MSIGQPVALVGQRLPLVAEPLPFVGKPLTFVSAGFPHIGTPHPLLQSQCLPRNRRRPVAASHLPSLRRRHRRCSAPTSAPDLRAGTPAPVGRPARRPAT